MRRPLPRACALTTLSFGSSHLDYSDSPGHASRIPGRHPSLRAARAMGRLDRTRGYYPDCGIQRGDMCNAPDLGQ